MHRTTDNEAEDGIGRGHVDLIRYDDDEGDNNVKPKQF